MNKKDSEALDAHITGQYENENGMDIEWMIDPDVTVVGSKHAEGHYLMSEWGGEKRSCLISYSPEGRMLFDGEDIETEEFMTYVGMIDQINEAPGNVVFFPSDGQTPVKE